VKGGGRLCKNFERSKAERAQSDSKRARGGAV